jgi:hypothetical protein
MISTKNIYPTVFMLVDPYMFIWLGTNLNSAVVFFPYVFRVSAFALGPTSA